MSVWRSVRVESAPIAAAMTSTRPRTPTTSRVRRLRGWSAEDAANGEKREEPADPSSAGPTAAPSSASSGQPPGACETRGPDGAKPVPAGLDAAGQPTGTLTLIASGARDDQNDGGADLASSTVTAGYIDDDGHYQGLTRAECQALLSLEATGQPVTVDIGSLGSYRVLATKDAETGDTVITGLSMKTDNALVRAQLLIEGAIAVAGTLIVALAGSVMVRSALAPLKRVACTAERVASQPLARGEVSIDERVPEADLTSSLEVGQVGSALNTLLGHVDGALAARQRSETQVRQFVADASHELRTPLASIRGYTELIAREGGDAALPEEAVHATRSSGAREERTRTLPAIATMRMPVAPMAPSKRSWVRTSALSSFSDRPVTTVSPVSASLVTRTRELPRESMLAVTGLPVVSRDSNACRSAWLRPW